METDLAIDNTEEPEITVHDLFEAYKEARLRRAGISFQRALQTPHIKAGMRGSAIEKKRRQAH